MSRSMTNQIKWSMRPAKTQIILGIATQSDQNLRCPQEYPWVLGCPLGAQRRLWSDWAHESSLGAHVFFVSFVVLQLRWTVRKAFVLHEYVHQIPPFQSPWLFIREFGLETVWCCMMFLVQLTYLHELAWPLMLFGGGYSQRNNLILGFWIGKLGHQKFTQFDLKCRKIKLLKFILRIVKIFVNFPAMKIISLHLLSKIFFCLFLTYIVVKKLNISICLRKVITSINSVPRNCYFILFICFQFSWRLARLWPMTLDPVALTFLPLCGTSPVLTAFR